MVYVRIELWPRGYKENAKLLGEAFIANDCSGSATRGNYTTRLVNSQGRLFRAGAVKNFPRKRLNAFDLLFRALRETVGSRNAERHTRPHEINPQTKETA